MFLPKFTAPSCTPEEVKKRESVAYYYAVVLAVCSRQ